jgi:two-component system nitrogen regulation response regulator NtrX
MNGAEILVVDDEADIRTLIEEILSDEGYSVHTARDASEARARVADRHPDLVLLDIWMPDTDGITLLSEWSSQNDLLCPVVIMSGHGTVETAVEATRLGAVDYVEKPLSLVKLLRTVEKALEKNRSLTKTKRSQTTPLMSAPLGKSQAMVQLRDQATHVAPQDTPIWITGENGSGREVFARYVHAMSGHEEGPFIKCAAATVTPHNLSQLILGTEHAGGVDPGYLEQANGGTLYISDLQDLCAEAQTLLAGILAQGSFVRLGRTEQIPLNVRFIVSSRPLAGEIRSDLLAELSQLSIEIPPLRQYPEDISYLLRHFVDNFVDEEGRPFRRFSVAAQNRLRNYPWPGNIHELSQLVRRLLIADAPEDIGLGEVEKELMHIAHSEEPLVKQDLLSMPLRKAREEFERAYLTQQLALCDGKVGRLAKRVGMERTHLYRKLRSLGINFRQIADDV